MPSTRIPHTLSALLAATALFVGRSASAQTSAPGFAVSHFNPSERGSDWFVTESLDLRGHHRVAVGVVVDYAHDPLVAYDEATGDKVASLISNQFYAHFGASYVLWERLRLSLNLPILLAQGGETLNVDGETLSVAHGTHFGDLRAGADVRLFGAYREPITVAIGAQLYFPTGDQAALAGDGKFRFAPRALAAGEIGPFVYSGRFEFVVRSDHPTFDGESGGNDLFFAGAAGLRVEKFVFGPELFGTTSLQPKAFEKANTPVEILFGAHFLTNDVRLGLGVGPGLTRGVGAPDVRVVGNVEWAPQLADAPPPPPPVDPDRDRDGVENVADACPDLAGVRNEDPKLNGCPVQDRDADQIADAEDACPDQAGVPTADPKTNGCPPPKDADKDGIPDELDACPNEAGVATTDPKTNGCPPPKDSDADGVLDPDDACPNAAGPKSDDPKTNGCPTARLEQNEIRILEPVKFATNSDRLVPESEPVLTSVMEVLQAHKEVTKLEVRGHTDSRGGAAANLNLSKRRAASVMKWLIAHGVAPERLGSNGFGQTRPIDSNDTEEGRKNNRRVEFRIIATAAE